MLGSIKQFFETNIANRAQDDTEHRLQLATAALMIEMMHQDDQAHEAEDAAIRQALKKKFSLNDDETDALFNLAHAEQKQATDYFQFTRLINENFSQPQKIKVIEYLWQVAYADGHLDNYEEHMVRKIADLLYISHSDFIRSKHKVIAGG